MTPDTGPESNPRSTDRLPRTRLTLAVLRDAVRALRHGHPDADAETPRYDPPARATPVPAVATDGGTDVEADQFAFVNPRLPGESLYLVQTPSGDAVLTDGGPEAWLRADAAITLVDER